jgi:hypothetical protein
MPRLAQGMGWLERVFVTVCALNIALILASAAIVPSSLRSGEGIVALIGAALMQVALAAAALWGPFALRRWQDGATARFTLGVAFAVTYLAIILAEFLGVHDNINILYLFIAAAAAAGLWAGLRTGQWRQGVMAGVWGLVIGTALWTAGDLLINYAFWGSHQQYAFMLEDGAVNDFRRAGGGDWNAFLIQDILGATFFHPLLSIIVGAIAGVAGGVLARGAIMVRARAASAS